MAEKKKIQDLDVPVFVNKNYDKKMKRNHKKEIKKSFFKKFKSLIIMILVIVISLLTGFLIGKNYVIKNQEIYSQNGIYYSIINDQIHYYE